MDCLFTITAQRDNGGILEYQGIIRDITERKRLEEIVEMDRQELKLIIDSSPIIIFYKDTEGKFIRVNKTFAKALKMPEDDFVGKTVFDLYSPQLAQRMADDDQDVLRSGRPKLHIIHQDESADGIRWIETDKIPIYDKHGILSGLIGFAQDITESKRAEEALRENERRYRRLVNHSLLGIGVSCEDQVLFANPALLRLFGYDDLEEFIRIPLLNHVAPASHKLINARMERIKHREPTPAEFEYDIQRKDGTIKTLLASSAHFKVQDKIYTQTTFQDITERKQAEKLLQQDRETFSTILAHAMYGVVLIEKDGRYLYVNREFTAITGYTLEDTPTGEDWMHKAFPDKEYRQKVLEFWNKDRGLEGVNREFRVVCKDGGIKQIDFRPTRLPDGRAVVMLADVTERKQAEEALRRSYYKLRETLVMTVNALASTVEMRDPYTAGHQRRVTILACAIAEEMGLTGEQFDGLHFAGLVHDIGKNSVPMEILNKPGRISEMESNIIKIHPQSGYNLLKEIEFSWPVAQIVLQHHERLDGSGYPQGLKNGEIMLEAKILAVADVVEAMVSYRPYRPALGIEAALEEITKNREILYDPEVVDVCTRLFRENGFRLE
jgi:PAS domain S-box-containing protein